MVDYSRRLPPPSRGKPSYEYVRSVVAGIERHQKNGFPPTVMGELRDSFCEYALSLGVRTVLDYGCGKYPEAWRASPDPFLRRLRFTLYDPCVEAYAQLPQDHFDLVLAANVFEYAALKDLNWLFSEVVSMADLALFLVVDEKAPEPLIPLDVVNPEPYDRPLGFWQERLLKALRGKRDLSARLLFQQSKRTVIVDCRGGVARQRRSKGRL